MHLKGRQAAFPDIARQKLNRVVNELEDVARPDGEVKVRGPFIFVTLIPK